MAVNSKKFRKCKVEPKMEEIYDEPDVVTRTEKNRQAPKINSNENIMNISNDGSIKKKKNKKLNIKTENGQQELQDNMETDLVADIKDDSVKQKKSKKKHNVKSENGQLELQDNMETDLVADIKDDSVKQKKSKKKHNVKSENGQLELQDNMETDLVADVIVTENESVNQKKIKKKSNVLINNMQAEENGEIETNATTLNVTKQKGNKRKRKTDLLELEETTKVSEKKAKKDGESKSDETFAIIDKAIAKTKHSEKSNDSSDDESDDEAAMKKYDIDFGFDEVAEKEYTKVLEKEEEEEDEEMKEQETTTKIKNTEDINDLQRTVHAYNVHHKTNKKELVKIFKVYGSIENIRCRNFPVSDIKKYKMKQITKNKTQQGRCSMSAYIKFKKPEEAEAALKANCTELQGHHIFVKSAVPKSTGENKTELSKGLTILVGNLPKHAEEEKLYKHFRPCGEITSISIMRKLIVCTGIAFITFTNKEDVKKALALNGTGCEGRVIRVVKAVRKEKMNKADKAAYMRKKFQQMNDLQSKKQFTQNNSASSVGQNGVQSGVHSRLEYKNNETQTSGSFRPYTGAKSDAVSKMSNKSRKLNRSQLYKRNLAKKLAMVPKKKEIKK